MKGYSYKTINKFYKLFNEKGLTIWDNQGYYSINLPILNQSLLYKYILHLNVFKLDEEFIELKKDMLQKINDSGEDEEFIYNEFLSYINKIERFLIIKPIKAI